MKRGKKTPWNANDVFAVPLINGNYATGHILDQRMVNTVRIALYNEVLKDVNNVKLDDLPVYNDLIALIEVTREQLDYGVWKILGNKPTELPVESFANEQFRANNWINSVVKDAAIAEDFLNAYYGLLPWDKYYDPAYFDKMLIDRSRKPDHLIYKK